MPFALRETSARWRIFSWPRITWPSTNPSKYFPRRSTFSLAYALRASLGSTWRNVMLKFMQTSRISY